MIAGLDDAERNGSSEVSVSIISRHEDRHVICFSQQERAFGFGWCKQKTSMFSLQRTEHCLCILNYYGAATEAADD
jgi:hypothetical protein